jgi:hypothetical protein
MFKKGCYRFRRRSRDWKNKGVIEGVYIACGESLEIERA